MRTLLVVLVLGLAGTSLAAADSLQRIESAAKAQAQSRDAWGLYRKVGRAWVRKAVNQGGKEYHQRGEIIEVGENHAVLKTVACRPSGAPLPGEQADTTTTRIEFKAAAAPAGEPERITTPAGEFACIRQTVMVDDLEFTFWHSTEYGGLVVQSKSPTLGTQLVKWWPDGAPEIKPEPVVDAYALYRKKGRNWTMKTVVNIQGMDPMVTYMKTEVVEVAEDHAMVKFWMMDKDKKPFAGMPEPEPTKIQFTAPAEPGGNPDDPEGMVRRVETIKVEAGEFECDFIQINDMKTWTSRKHPGLLVKSESEQFTNELVEYKD